MRQRNLTGSEGQQLAGAYPFVLVRELSRVYLGMTAQANIQWPEVTEARFFNDTSEVRFWDVDGVLHAALIEDDQETENSCLERTYQLAYGGAFGRRLTVVEYLAYDEDGQLYRVDTRLKRWEA